MNSSAFFPVSKTFNALSGDVQWLSQLMQGEGYGRIHSVFERVVNLEQEGALFTLAGRSCDR